MGYLLKEALKALCGDNQWSYAVFWKIGCQNPKLLIWEEYHHTALTCSDAPHNSTTRNHEINMQKLESYKNAAQAGELVGDQVRLLVDKMMMSNHVNMVGQGLVGRASFMGNHQWIVSGSYNEKCHPTEVANEIRQQFSAGMQTVVVIPVIPHGVVQLGSPLAIMENVGFVHDVRSLILQVGCVPNVFVSDNYVTKDATSMFGLPVSDAIPVNLHGNTAGMNSSPLVTSGFSLMHSSSQDVKFANNSSDSLLTQFQDNLQVGVSNFSMPYLTPDLCRSRGGHFKVKSSLTAVVDSCAPLNSLEENNITQGVVMPSKPDSLLNHPTCSTNKRSSPSFPQPSLSCSGSIFLKQQRASASHETNKDHYASLQGYGTSLSRNTAFSVRANGQNGQSSQKSACTDMAFDGSDYSVKEFLGISNTADEWRNNSTIAGSSEDYIDNGHTVNHISGKSQNNDINEVPKMTSKSSNFIPDGLCSGTQVPSSLDLMSQDIFFQSTIGDDLFDVLGIGLKNKLLNGNDGKFENQFGTDPKKDLPTSLKTLQNLGSRVRSDYEGFSESGIFSTVGSDHLLDAVISGVNSTSRQISDDNVSCRTTVSKISTSSVPSTPHSNPQLSRLVNNMPDQLETQQGEVPGISKPIVRLGEPVGSSIRSGCDKSGSCSLNGSAYTSQINSWVEQGASASVSTANSKKPEESGKSNRKRLKPGENPRPRPKDRQMIQDRVKELREIVPNGAKCSIDALLERTIKHMLFLQSVTMHAEKLKHTVKSKIANKEGGMLLNEQFEGGATWAFELGSQSMVYPIVVEDLNPPRQLLIEMLCEERGLFLEIADIIRGLGLTILKGVMESRNEKIWGRFAVEANRDVTRMEVFISLVHTLEQTLKASTSANVPTASEPQLVG